MKNKIILLTLMMAFLPLASANVLIELPQQDANIDGLQKSFEIGFVNTGSETVNLTLNSTVQTDLQVQRPNKLVLQPSEITSTPEGGGWYYLGDQKYAEIQDVRIETEIPLDTNTRRHEFDLSISRVYQTRRNRPNVETVQEISFSIFSTSDSINTGFQQSGDNEQEEKKENASTEGNNTGSTVQEPEYSEEPVENTSSNASKTTPDKSSSAVDSVTILLVLGILLAVAWIFKEVLM